MSQFQINFCESFSKLVIGNFNFFLPLEKSMRTESQYKWLRAYASDGRLQSHLDFI